MPRRINNGKVKVCWGEVTPVMAAYHDTEWGVPVYDDRALFEHLVLDGAQAGLSWSTILNKREAYREAFHRFDPEKIARYGQREINRLMANPGIVRNRMKIVAAIQNARGYLKFQEEEGRFGQFLWSFVGGRQKVSKLMHVKDMPATSVESEAMSKALKQRGFQFVGPTICYAFMQAVGMVNDHHVECPRFKPCQKPARNRSG